MANVVTAVPGRTVAVAASGAGVVEAAGREVSVVAERAGFVVGVVVVVGAGADAGCASSPGGVELVELVGPVRVEKAGESAFAGTQPETATTSRTQPAAAGQRSSGRRIIRRDRHFRWGTLHATSSPTPVPANPTTLTEETRIGWSGRSAPPGHAQALHMTS
ncbi:hypothetical protein GCM10027080_06810 [Pedococcus soli]